MGGNTLYVLNQSTFDVNVLRIHWSKVDVGGEGGGLFSPVFF